MITKHQIEQSLEQLDQRIKAAQEVQDAARAEVDKRAGKIATMRTLRSNLKQTLKELTEPIVENTET